MPSSSILLLFLLFFVVVMALSWYFAYLRRKMWQEIAAKYGLRYQQGDPFGFTEMLSDFAFMQRGHSRRVSNTLDGNVDGMKIAIFDYRYTTGSGKNKTTHRMSCLMVELPIYGPHLYIRREDWFSTVASWIGMGDIEFESEEFNRRFKVTSNDKRFAYDICHTQMMEYLLANPEGNWEISHNRLLLYSSTWRQFDKDEVDRALILAKGFVDRIPEYLIKQQTAGR